MTSVLFQHIPRCLFEPVAIAGVVGFVIFLFLYWKKDRAEAVLAGGTILFMIGWRIVLPIKADRYAILLIPAAVFFSVYAIEQLTLFVRKYLPVPNYCLFLGILLIGCAVKSFHSNTEDRQFFKMIKILRDDARNSGKPVRVTSNGDLSCFLGDGFDVQTIHIHEPFRLSELPAGKYCLLKLNRYCIPADKDNSDFTLIAESHGTGTFKFCYYLWRRKEIP